eukprot:TRINITY_DN3610_c0_g1_i1.p1 TRINITY_DN3610_c0_g1~~TRINITY_DN3610_c0_g1_i1.p1  ORF type:complete len:505 (+),score=106.17 TRINITY_DN3610_c0_g1_i1:33-1547(+)
MLRSSSRSTLCLLRHSYRTIPQRSISFNFHGAREAVKNRAFKVGEAVSTRVNEIRERNRGKAIYDFARIEELIPTGVSRFPFGVYQSLIKPTLLMASTGSVGWYLASRGKIREGSPMPAVYTLMGVNAFIYLLWKIGRLQPLMHKYFMCSTVNPRLSPMILSIFSHKSILHLGLNMLAMWSIMGDLNGLPNFSGLACVAVYLAGGIFGNWTSLMFKLYTRRTTSSLGASGSVFSFFAMQHSMDQYFADPRRRSTGRNFYNSWFSYMVAFDLIGTFLLLRRSPYNLGIDHMAHLGGAAFAKMVNSKGSPLLGVVRDLPPDAGPATPNLLPKYARTSQSEAILDMVMCDSELAHLQPLEESYAYFGPWGAAEQVLRTNLSKVRLQLDIELQKLAEQQQKKMEQLEAGKQPKASQDDVDDDAYDDAYDDLYGEVEGTGDQSSKDDFPINQEEDDFPITLDDDDFPINQDAIDRGDDDFSINQDEDNFIIDQDDDMPITMDDDETSIH